MASLFSRLVASSSSSSSLLGLVLTQFGLKLKDKRLGSEIRKVLHQWEQLEQQSEQQWEQLEQQWEQLEQQSEQLDPRIHQLSVDIGRGYETQSLLMEKIRRNKKCINLWKQNLSLAYDRRMLGILVMFVEDARAQLALSHSLPSREHEPYPFSHIFQSPVYDTLKTQLLTAAGTDDVPTLVSKLHELVHVLDQNHKEINYHSLDKYGVKRSWLKDDDVCFEMLKRIGEHMHIKVIQDPERSPYDDMSDVDDLTDADF